MSSRAAIAFSNGLGNFILMTSALKILRSAGFDEIDLLTSKKCMKNYPSVLFLAERLFDDVITDFPLNKDYEHVFNPKWSFYDPSKVSKHSSHPIWWASGIHEVLVYLEAIGACVDDYCGMLMIQDESIKLSDKRPKIALANASTSNGSRRGIKIGWGCFPELSVALTELGFNVILVGQGSELDGCVGENFLDKLDISQTAGVIKQCDLMICTDTGLMHVADAVGTPIILLAGPTPVTKSHPLNVRYAVVRKFISCAPCFQSSLWHMCTKSLCMEHISVNDVLSTFFRFFSHRYYVPPESLRSVHKVKKDDPIDIDSDFNYLLSKINNSIYNPSYDMIGDTFGVAFLLQWIKGRYPEFVIRWFNSKEHCRCGDGWFKDFNVFDWVMTDIETYDHLTKDRVITCRKDFNVWSKLQYLMDHFNYYPEMKKKRLTKKLKEQLPENFIALHILQPTDAGERSGSYVKRRSLNFEKYVKLCSYLKADGLNVVRVGASYDSYVLIDDIIDLSQDNLSLDDTFRVLGASDAFISGDVGLKLAASALGIPCVVEIDDKSKSIGGLAGCDPSLVHDIPLGTSLEDLYLCVKGVL